VTAKLQETGVTTTMKVAAGLYSSVQVLSNVKSEINSYSRYPRVSIKYLWCSHLKVPNFCSPISPTLSPTPDSQEKTDETNLSYHWTNRPFFFFC
jgi:hypothetical protein